MPKSIHNVNPSSECFNLSLKIPPCTGKDTVPAGWCASGFYLHEFISKTCRVLKLKENERCFLGLSWPLQLAGGLGADPSEYCISCFIILIAARTEDRTPERDGRRSGSRQFRRQPQLAELLAHR
eukprot:s5043_g9.t1